MASGFNLTQLNNDLGAYYRQARQAILSKMYAVEELRNLVTVISGIQDEYVMTELEFDEIAQPYQKQWTPKGTGTFKPEIIKARPVKADLELDLKDLEAKWIGYLKTNGSSPQEFPFVQFIYQKIVERMARDLNKASINGVYSSPTAGTAGAANDSVDGFLQIISQAITDTKISPYTTGALSATSIIDDIEGFFDSIPTEMKELDLVLMMSPDWARTYFRKRRETFGNNQDYTSAKRTVDFTNTRIVTPTYWNGSDRLVITPAENVFMVEDGVNEEDEIRTQLDKRTINAMIDCKRGVGFGVLKDYVFSNDAA